MDGLFHGSKPYFQMDGLGVPLFLETPKYDMVSSWIFADLMRFTEYLPAILKNR